MRRHLATAPLPTSSCGDPERIPSRNQREQIHTAATKFTQRDRLATEMSEVGFV